MIEDDGTIRPAVMVNKAEVWKEADADCLEPTLVTQSKGIALNLNRTCRNKALYIYIKAKPFIILMRYVLFIMLSFLLEFTDGQ